MLHPQRHQLSNEQLELLQLLNVLCVYIVYIVYVHVHVQEMERSHMKVVSQSHESRVSVT